MQFARKLLSSYYEEAFSRLNFPNCHNFENIVSGYSYFIQKRMDVTDLAAPIKSS